MTRPALDLVVLVSGSGSNLQAILDSIAKGTLDARVRLVVSNKSDAFALARARLAGVPTRVISHRDFHGREAFDAELRDVVQRAFDVEDRAAESLVVLAGFMRLLTPTFLDAFSSRILNIHPSLLPAFPGTHAQRQALDHGVRITGCTVHLVDAGTDTGPILAQAAVPIVDGDDEASLTARLLKREHTLLPLVLRWISEGRLDRSGKRPRLVGVTTALGLADESAFAPST
jgi:phosphoribosylglycinamide formyltransferase-1